MKKIQNVKTKSAFTPKQNKTTQSKNPLNNTPIQSTDRRRIDIGRARIGQHHLDLKSKNHLCFVL